MKLKELRHKNGLSQKELADLVGVDRTTVIHWESGKNGATLKTLIKVAEVLHVSVDELVGNDEEGSETDIVPIQTNEREEKILHLFRKLSPEAQEIFFVQLKAVAAAQEKERLFKK